MSSPELKFLVDLGVGNKVEECLQEKGYDTKTVRTINARMSDHEIIRFAHSEGRMVITMDKDFGGVSLSFFYETLRSIIVKVGRC